MADDISFLQEIDESLRAEKAEQFWRDYGGWLLAGCAAIVLLTAANVWWQNHQRARHEVETHAMLQAQALRSEDKFAEAEAAFAKARAGSSDLTAMAALGEAEAQSQTGKTDKALATYKDIASGKFGRDIALRDTAAVDADILAGNRGESAAERDAVRSLETGLGSTRPFASEEEMLAALRPDSGKKSSDILARIAADAKVAQSERQRADELLDSPPKEKP